MNKTVQVKLGCLLICLLLMTGCSAIPGSLERAYSYTDRLQTIQTPSANVIWADSFAKDLCVVTDESAFTDRGINAGAAAIFNVSDKEVVYSNQAHTQLYPASTTKIMTALLVLKYGNLTDRVTVTEDAVITEAGATLCGIKPGDKLTMEQLLYGLMIPSGNDAANAIAVHMADSLEAFSEMMNKEALALGATNTHFVNAHGLNNEEQYTTAYDLYLIFNELLKYDKFKEVIGATSYTATYTDGAGEEVSQTWNCGNWYITGEEKAPEGIVVLGGKTGTTSAAGYCLIMLSKEDQSNKQYISVVLKAGNRKSLYNNMTKLLTKAVD